MEKLLPCPFCGGEAEILNYGPNKDIGYREPYTAQCSKECCCLGKDFRTREEAAEAWNRRAQPQQPDVVHGRWVHIIEDGMTVAGKCSNCGYTIFNDSDETNYCPSCGTKMDGGENENLKQILTNSPTIDPIHAAKGCYCRECKLRGNPDSCPLLYYNRDMIDEHKTDDNDFCSYGERREGDQNG